MPNISQVVTPPASSAIGDIKHSVLDEADFVAANDATWILADGRDVTGSDYDTETGNTTVPDFRGVFLRGRNDGGSSAGVRADGFEDPNGLGAIGANKASSTAQPAGGNFSTGTDTHTHQVQTHGGGGPSSIQPLDRQNYSGSAATYPVVNPAHLSSDTHSHTVNGGDTETAPKHSYVNYYIKINA